MIRFVNGVLLSLLCLASDAIAQSRLHLIVVHESKDKNVADQCKEGVKGVASAIREQVPPSQLNVITLNGDKINPREIQAISKNAMPNDAIMFLYSGHGSTDNNGSRSIDCDGGQVPRDIISSVIFASNCRLKIFVTDMCSVYNRRKAVAGPEFAAPAPGILKRGLVHLFFNFSGDIDICSSSIDEQAKTERIGTAFTNSMSQVLGNAVDAGVSWDRIIQDISLETRQVAEKEFASEPGQFLDRRGRPVVQTTQTVDVLRLDIRAISNPTSNLTPPNSNNTNPLSPPDSMPGTGKRQVLGVVLSTCQHGVHVDSVTENSPATRLIELATSRVLTLDAGDHILAINGQSVQDHQTAISLIQASGKEMQIDVLDSRTGQAIALMANLEETADSSTPNNPVPPKRQLGVQLRNTSQGVIVDKVIDGTPATRVIDVNTRELLMLESGDYIEAINGTSVSDQQTASSLISSSGRIIRLQIRDSRTNQTRIMETTLE